jgi:Zn-dependent metalloprotease
MKRKILPFLVLSFIVIKAYPQSFVSKSIRAQQGISQQFTPIDDDQSISFNSAQLKSLLDLNSNSELVLQRTENDKLGFIHYRYYQTYRNIPIENTMYIIHTKNGLLKSLGGTIVTDFDSRIDARAAQKISGDQAINIAVQFVGASIYAWKDAGMEKSIKQQKNNLKATYFPNASLVWYSSSEGVNPRELRLCYKVNVYALKPLSNANYFVDVQTGRVLGKKDIINFSDVTGTANTGWSGSQTIHSDLVSASNYRLRDYSRGSGIITLHGESGQRGVEYTSTSNNWSLGGTDQAAMDAHYGVEQTYSFYMATFGRNSYDGAGTALYSYVNDPTYIDNAFWDGSAMNYNKRTGSNYGVTGIDVTGHELTHGVTQTSSGLNYSYESGAINESMSDIMGKSVQFFAKPSDVNWQLSNDMGWIIRDMSNPNLEGQPDTYLGTDWYTGSGDNGGVHYNSGVGNFMFYLLVNGGSGTNDNGDSYTVTGIGLSEADQILYRTNTTYLVPTSQYADWRTACINAAADLYGVSSNEVNQVENAWHAVGVGLSAGTCETPGGITAESHASTSAILSWNTVEGATGYKLSYKEATASGWTVVTVHHVPYTLSGLTANTKYKFKVQSICAGGLRSTYSAVNAFKTLHNGQFIYCGIQGSTGYEFIDNVTIGALTNTSGNDGGYGDYTNLVKNLTAGSQVKISLIPGYTGSAYTEYFTVYIDYNQNGVFTDPGEKVMAKNGTAKVWKKITIPANAANGNTRMRVIMQFDNEFPGSCGDSFDGEAEDYTVHITGGTFADAIAVSDAQAVSLNNLLVTPNPVKGSSASLVLQAAKTAPVNINITDLSGRILRTETISNVTAGKNNYPLHNINLMPGTYMIIAVQSNAIIARTQFIVAK